MGTITVNIRISALTNILPPKYSKEKNNKNRIGKIIFRQLKKVGIKQNIENTTMNPFNGNLNKVLLL